MKDYTISCREDQTLCRRALCECDLEFATKITSFPDFALSHNHTLLQRNGFDFEKSCPKRGTPGIEEISCCGDRKSFPNVSIMNGKKDSCCGNLAYNSNREGQDIKISRCCQKISLYRAKGLFKFCKNPALDCCAGGVLAKIGKCDVAKPYILT